MEIKEEKSGCRKKETRQKIGERKEKMNEKRKLCQKEKKKR